MIAYEPVWAIGTGLTPTAGDVAEAHAFMRKEARGAFRRRGLKMRISMAARSSVERCGTDGGRQCRRRADRRRQSLKSSDFLAICGVV